MNRWLVGGLFSVLVISAGSVIALDRGGFSPAPAMAQQRSVLLKSGAFRSGEHPTSGGARIVEIGGKYFVEFDGKFKTDAGPDLFVILHRSNNVIGTTKAPTHSLNEGDYLLLAPLRATQGSQRYAIPPNANLADYGSVAIWCRQFNATFGAAALANAAR